MLCSTLTQLSVIRPHAKKSSTTRNTPLWVFAWLPLLLWTRLWRFLSLLTGSFDTISNRLLGWEIICVQIKPHFRVTPMKPSYWFHLNRSTETVRLSKAPYVTMFQVNSTRGRASKKASLIFFPSRSGKTVDRPEPTLCTTISWGGQRSAVIAAPLMLHFLHCHV